jgi:hypothetical protein
MSSIDKAFSLSAQPHGFDDIGFAQATGTINSARQYKTGKWAKYALLESAAAHGLTKGQAINIINTTDYDGPTRVVDVSGPTAFVIKRAFSVTKTGNWDLRTAEGNWDGIQPLGDNATGSTNITFEFWKPGMEAGLQPAVAMTKDVIYPMPGLKKVTINSSGNLRLIRAASVRPGDGINKNAPTIVAYNPATASIGATLDILGTNFDPIPDRNSVQFLTSPTGGVYAKVTNATEEILTIVIPTGVAATGVISVKCNGGQNASGPVFTAG